MFVRKVMTILKPNSISKFSLLMEQEVVPMLRKQKGFQDELAFFAPSEDAVTTISLWDKAASAEASNIWAFRGTFYDNCFSRDFEQTPPTALLA